MMNQQWFEMPEIIKRSLSTAVWLPVRASQTISKSGEFGHLGFSEEFFGAASVLILNSARAKIEGTDWGDINHDQAPYMEKGRYQSAGVFKDDNRKPIGTYLVLRQPPRAKEYGEWHLHQDFVLAFRLKREGDKWICPEEDYIEVARLTRDADGKPALFEVRAEYLKDFMCARKMGLYVASYRQRVEVVEGRDHINWKSDLEKSEGAGIRWEGRITAIHEGGHPFGAETAVLHMGRTDVDPEIDVPFFDVPGTDENMESKSWTTRQQGKQLFRIEGALWRSEWIPAAKKSPRFREDEMPPTVFFITDESGKRESRETLDNGSRWLWFRPEVMVALAHRRGGSLSWYTRDTGDVRCSPDHDMHFGINKLGMVNVYAPDIGRLPDWQQRIWAGYNVGPEGGVSEELLASQMRARPANTQAPEAYLPRGIELLNDITQRKFGFELFREHDEYERLIQHSHRFRATDRPGLLALAKDLARLTADSINIAAIHKIITLPKDKKLGSLKSLETLLAKYTDENTARNLLTPLVGIYEMRLGDAHLPSSELEEALRMAQIDLTVRPVFQGLAVLNSCVSVLYRIAEVLDPHARPSAGDGGN